jgi:galactofuranose transport system permease protein
MSIDARRRTPSMTGDLLRRGGVGVALIVVLAIGAWRSPDFLAFENVLNVVRQNAVLALIAIGMTMVIVAGGIDLSVGSAMTLCSVVAVKLAPHGLVPAALAALFVGAAIGFGNGLIVAKFRIAPFIATLASLLALRGVTIAAFGEETVPLNEGRAAFTTFGRAVWLGAPVQAPIVIVVAVIAIFVLRQTRFGRSIYALGGNEESARMLGLRVDRIKIAVYAISGALSGLAGMLFAVRVAAGITNYGLGLELDAITAVALGGTLLTGGIGGVTGTLAGVALIGFLFNIFNLDATLSPFFQKVVRGLLLTLVVVIQSSLTKRRK